MLYFSPGHIASLKSAANRDLATFSYDSGGSEGSGSSGDEAAPVTFVSANDVVSARMWQAFNQLPSHTPGHRTRFLRAIDLRARLSQPGSHTHSSAGAASSSSSSTTQWSSATAGGSKHTGQQVEHRQQYGIGNWAHIGVSAPMPAREAPLGQLAAELRRATTGRAGREQGLASMAYWDWAEKQGVMRRVWLTGTTVFGGDDSRTNVDTAATTWDFNAADLDFGSGAPIWFQWPKPSMIMNHIVVLTGFSGNPAHDDGKHHTGGSRGAWVLLSLPPEDMRVFLQQGLEVV